MACRVLCPSLPDLLRKTILTFCEGSVKFEHCLEVTGSLHIRSDNEKVTTFLLDELVSRTGDGDEQCIDLSIVNHEDRKQTGQYEDEESAKQHDSFMMPKKSRKLKRPVRKLTYDYNENYESSEGESDFEYAIVDQNQNETEAKTAPHQFERVQRRLRDSLDNTDSNASLSSEEANRHRSGTVPRDNQVVSPNGQATWEVTSTRPDDTLAIITTPPSANSPSTNDIELPPPQEEPTDLRREATPPEKEVESHTDGPKIEEVSRENLMVKDPYLQLYEQMALARQLNPALNLTNMFPPLPLDVSTHMPWLNMPHLRQLADHMQKEAGEVSSAAAMTALYAQSAPLQVKTEAPSRDEETWEKQISCAECGKLLKSPKMLQIHMNTAHTHKNVYPCKQCGKQFYAASSLHSHRKRTHTSWEQKLKCTVCPRTFAFQSELLRHLDTAHNVSQYNVATNLSTSNSHLNYPPLLSPPQPPVIISPALPALDPVTNVSPNTSTPDSHESQRQEEPVGLDGKPPMDSQPRQYPPTEEVYNKEHQSIQDSYDERRYVEERANEPKAREDHFVERKATNDAYIDMKQAEEVYAEARANPVMVQSSEGMRYKCTICGMLLKSKECLALHINAKHTQKHAYPCHFCGRVFYAPSSRFCHVRRVHTSSEQKFKCLYCWKVFTFHYELRNHMKMMHRSKMANRSALPDSADHRMEIEEEISNQ